MSDFDCSFCVLGYEPTSAYAAFVPDIFDFLTTFPFI